MDERLAFLTPDHRAVRNFVVRELPGNGGRPLATLDIAKRLRFDPKLVERLLDDLERNLFFLVRNRRGEVSWAFPVTSDRTPHQLRFSTGERIYGACAEDAFATALIQGRLRKQKMEVEITSSCAHCGQALEIVVNERMEWRSGNRGADPHLFMPSIDWKNFRARNIIDDF